MMKIMMAFGILLITVPAWAANPTVGAKGLYCWQPNTDTDTTGYRIYSTNPSNVMTMIDAGKPTTAPPNPNPAGKPCTTGSVGILRDQTGSPDGSYSTTITAYDAAGNESAKATAYIYPLDQTPPAGVVGGVVAQ